MANEFERTVAVDSIGKFDSFKGNDGKYYKAVGKGMALSDFKVGSVYDVRGYSSESGKTNYITAFRDAVPTAAAPAAVAAPAKTTGRKIAPPKPAESAAVPGDSKSLNTPRPAVGGRDFTKEAKGKTFSLIVAALAHQELDVATILDTADKLLAGIEARGYF